MSAPAAGHTLHAHQHHHGWNRDFAPALTIAPGETVAFETVDASGAQLAPGSTLDDLKALDFARINPVTGPVRGIAYGFAGLKSGLRRDR